VVKRDGKIVRGGVFTAFRRGLEKGKAAVGKGGAWFEVF
jgi:hypothetical protein